MTKNHLARRPNGNYSFRMTVPEDLRDKVGKREIWETLGTSNRSVANALAAQRVLHWKGVFLSYQAETGSLSSKSQRDRAAIQGFEFFTAQALSDATTKDKVAMLFDANNFLSKVATPTREQIAANSGVVEESLSLDQLFERFRELNAAKWGNPGSENYRKKTNRYKEPISDFKREMGDLDVLKLTTRDAANYATNIGKRIVQGDFISVTGQQKLVFMNAMVKRYSKTTTRPERTRL